MKTNRKYDFTGEELVKKAYNDSEEKGHEYEKVVKYIESIKSKLK